MKIALIGYGKMGHAIERIAIRRGHEIVCTIDAGEENEISLPRFRNADIAIEFTAPSAAVGNYRLALAAGMPVVSGTTGWTSALPEVKEILAETGGTLFWASNFSIGVNLFMRINAYAAKLFLEGRTYNEIIAETDISSTTLSRISRAITHGSGGYKNFISYSRKDEI